MQQNTYAEVLEMQAVLEELEVCRLQNENDNDETENILIAVSVLCAASILANVAAFMWIATKKSRGNDTPAQRPWSNPLTDDNLTGSFLGDGNASESSFVLSPQ